MAREKHEISRRSMIAGAGALGALAASASAAEKPVTKGRLKQSVCKWCYPDLTIEELAENCAQMGIRSSC